MNRVVSRPCATLPILSSDSAPHSGSSCGPTRCFFYSLRHCVPSESSLVLKSGALRSALLPRLPPRTEPAVSLLGPLRRKKAFDARCLLGHEELSAIYDLAVGVGLPCTVMECGDVIYRSTLPRTDPFQLTTGGAALALLVSAYLWATPGVAPGFWDMFLLAPLETRFRPNLSKPELNLGKKLGEGAFGTVYRATFANPPAGKERELVVKRAVEFGAVEIWMNERVRRACPSSCAEFISGFVDKSGKAKNEEFWLVWQYEGDSTLADIMQSKDFPYNVEDAVLGPNALKNLPRCPERENKVIRALMSQLLTSLNNLHSIGIVHRDIKPQNIIFCRETGNLKIIDLGAAADLRVGINYAPKEFLLDPRFAAPEQYIMSTQTPSAPPPAVAATLSPVLWQMNLPDRFDIYSAGLIFLQMAFPNLRSDNNLIQFNRQLKRLDYDLEAWRESLTKKRGALTSDLQRGFSIMDLDDGAGWGLVQTMIRFKSRERTSAGGALAHPYFYPGSLSSLQKLRLFVLRRAYANNSETTEAFMFFMSKSGSEKEGGLSEVELEVIKDKERKEQKKKATMPRNALASALKLRRQVIRTLSTTQTVGDQQDWWNRWQS